MEIEEINLISRRKRIESKMNELNNKPPVIDHNGRYHSPFDGYIRIDEFNEKEKKFLGGEYLPVENFSTENKYYKEVTEKINRKYDIPYVVCKEMVELGYNQTGKQYCISRFKGNQKHKGIDKVEIVTCLIETDVWHFNKLIDYIIDTRLVLRSQINHPLRLSARDSDPIRNISHWIELKDDE